MIIYERYLKEFFNHWNICTGFWNIWLNPFSPYSLGLFSSKEEGGQLTTTN